VARTLTRTLYVVSIVPIATGLWTVVAGADSVPDPNLAPPNVESELRFYSVWWIGAGLFLAWLAPRVTERTLELRVFFALLFLGGMSRVFAAIDTDWPSTGQLVLMGLELLLPIVFVTWQARVKTR
jgi:FtsH-binding integral membrane protein